MPPGRCPYDIRTKYGKDTVTIHPESTMLMPDRKEESAV